MQKELVQSDNPAQRKIQKVQKYWDILMLAQNIKIRPLFGHFLEAG
jgi:hypothetical protein